jgi:ABC-2 type transport system permease protein
MNRNILLSLVTLLPMAIFYIALGLLFGSVCNVKQVGGICGALLTNLSAWLSGVWFDLELVGDTFQSIARLLPFVHGVELQRSVIAGDYARILPHLYPVAAFAIVTLLGAIWLFLGQMKRQ